MHAATDAQWLQIQYIIPGESGGTGRTAQDNRLIVDAILFIAKRGIRWRDLPKRLGKWDSVW